MTLRIDHVVTPGTFSIDGEDFEVDNNIWLVGDDDEVMVIDAAHDHRPIVDAIAGRGSVRPRAARTATTTTSTRQLPWPRPWTALILPAPRGPRCLGPGAPRARRRRARRTALPDRGGHDVQIRHTPGHRREVLPLRDAGTSCSRPTRCSTAGRAPPAGRFTDYDDHPGIRDRLLTLPEQTRRAHRPRRLTTIGAEVAGLGRS